MDIILLERVSKLGQMGDIVSVKQGYARNFLLPQGKALRATAGNKEHFKTQKAQLETQNLETKKEADTVAAKLDGEQFIVIRSSSDAGALYGSVSNRDIAEVTTEAGFTISKKQIILQAPIKELGLHSVTVTLHPETSCTIKLNVARSVEEAELQASGKSIQELAAEADADAEFEIAELFDDIGTAAIDDLNDEETAPVAEETSKE